MTPNKQRGNKRSEAHRLAPIALAAALLASINAQAVEIDVDNPELKIRWDNTLKYSAAIRTQGRSAEVVAAYNPNLDDGEYNFNKGLVSNRLDLLSEFDAVYRGNLGLRISAAGWYDAVYNRSNDNPGFAGGAVPNATSVASNQFTGATRRQHGRDAEILDAFVFGKAQVGDAAVSGRLGRHSLLWGESLFFGANGIAGGQAPVDIVKLLSVPNSQFKEVIRPVNQLSGQVQLSPTVSIGAYAQFEWERSRIPAVGSYLSRTDVLDTGAEKLYLPAFLGGPVARSSDMTPKNSGQGGLQLRWRSDGLDTDFGFYAIRFHDKDSQVYLKPGQDYRLVFHEGVKAYGASFSRSFGSVNLGGEVSVRHNTALVAAGGTAVDLTGGGNNSDHPLYPVGNSGHAQLSLIHSLERSSLWDGGLLLAEVAWHRRLSVTQNAAALDPNTTRDALGLRAIFSPTFYQAFSGVDVSVPIGLGYNPKGRSSVITLFNGGWDKGGDLSVGLNFEVQQTWKAGISYTGYFGKAGGVLDDHANYSFRQSLKDRNFLALTLQRTL